jgi:ATP-binding cassette subfamily A (ABC1) protein 3
MSIIPFSFLFARLFRNSKIAAIAAIVAWILTTVIYFIALEYEKYHENFGFKSNFLLSMLLPSCGIHFGFYNIIVLEWKREGLNWTSLFTRIYDHEVSVADTVLAMALGILISLIVISYLEYFYQDYSKPKKLLDLIQKKGNYREFNNQMSFPSSDEGNTKKPLIQIQGITKAFKRHKKVLDSVSFNLYDQEITFLLAKDESSKATLLDIVSGISSPTSGTISILEHDLKLGISQQSDVLISDLTVEEYLTFFSMSKGFTESQAKTEVDHYATQFGLNKNKLAGDLDGERKKILSIAIAFCGNPKIVVLDDPVSGLGKTNTNKVWSLIRKEKSNRSILIGSNSIMDAEMYGDRMIIIENGRIKIDGTPREVKECKGIGFQIFCEKSSNCDSALTTSSLQRVSQNIKLTNETSDKLIYETKDIEMPEFLQILEVLENEKHKLGIYKLTVKQRNLESVFLESDSMQINTVTENFDEVPCDNSDEIAIIATSSLDTRAMLEGPRLIFNQFRAIFLKKFYFLGYYRNSLVVNVSLTLRAGNLGHFDLFLNYSFVILIKLCDFLYLNYPDKHNAHFRNDF